jgi:hypothetical protein
MGTNRQIDGRLIINDLRSGLRDRDLQGKHKISSYGLLTVYKKLLAHNAISHSELCERSPLYKERNHPARQRKYRRVYPYVPIKMYEVEALANGILSNVSEKGLRVAGIEATIGNVQTFQIYVNLFMHTDPLVIAAKCKWIELMGQNQKYLAAGFEITDLSERDSKTLKDFIRLLVLCESAQSRMA